MVSSSRASVAGSSARPRSASGIIRSSWVEHDRLSGRSSASARAAAAAPTPPAISPGVRSVRRRAVAADRARALARSRRRRFCPPERSDGRRCLDGRRGCPDRAARSARARAARPLRPAARNGTWTFSDAVRLEMRLNDWKTMPTLCRACTPSTIARERRDLRSRSFALPPAGRRIAASTESSVVFPQPLAPRSRASSPPATSKSRPSTGRTR